VVRRLGHKVQAGVYILRYGHLVRNNTIVTSPYQRSTNYSTATQLRRTMVPETSWWWCVSLDVVVMGLAVHSRQIGQGLITQGDSYVRVYWCLISIRLYSVSCSLPFYSTVPAPVLRGKNYKRCHLCRGNSSRQGPQRSSIETSNTRREAGCFNRGPNGGRPHLSDCSQWERKSEVERRIVTSWLCWGRRQLLKAVMNCVRPEIASS
jgi:hypothetical protein